MTTSKTTTTTTTSSQLIVADKNYEEGGLDQEGLLVATSTTPPSEVVEDNDITTTQEVSSSSSSSSSSSFFASSLVLLLLSQFILFIGVGAVIPAIPLYGQDIGLSRSANGIVISTPAIAMLLLSKFGGNYADIARKPAMILGMTIITISDIGTAFSTTLLTLVVARLGLGIGRCLAESGERGMLADLGKMIPSLRGRSLAAQQAAIALGIAIGSPIGGYVIDTYGPRLAFLCVSTGAFIALILYTFLPETIGIDAATIVENNEAKTSEDDDGRNNDKRNDIVDDDAGEWLNLLRDNRWKGLAACQCGASFGFACKMTSIPIIATQVLPGGATGAGTLLSIAGLSGLIGAPVGGWLTDRTNNARLTAVCSGIVCATALMLIPVVLNYDGEVLSSLMGIDVVQAVTTLVSSYIPPTTTMIISGKGIGFAMLVVLWSLGVTAQGPALMALGQKLAPKGSEATALALPRAAGDGTYIVAPFILGVVADYQFHFLSSTGSASSITGIECGVAGVVGLLGAIALAITGDNESKNVPSESNSIQ